MLPMTVPAAGLPASVKIYEVGPRDGLQNEQSVVSLATKVEFIRRLAQAGLPVVETTSFVHPRWVPQLADAAELYSEVSPSLSIPLPALVPNLAGLRRALDAGVKDIAVFASATQTFAKRNLNSSLDRQLSTIAEVARVAMSQQVRMRAYVSMCFGDPWEGPVPIEQVVDVGVSLINLGAYELSLGDTIGVATPGHVWELIDAFGRRGVTPKYLAMHFHDTYGQALANTFAALQAGVATFDASAGGLGGCPYAESATGNLATEDLVWMLNGLGIAHGVDLRLLAKTSAWMAVQLGREPVSAVVRALQSRASRVIFEGDPVPGS